ncbi:MAG: DUF2783 domain-containing protein [Paracoccus sp. (in: a-proteobacteria)]|nr:DUF2783 domain-containing protein [Paracoccus sp. (in: a-proteobacteria)]
MTDLILTPNLPGQDDLYADLLVAHEGLSKAQSDALNARLILILMNQLGDADLIRSAIATARLPQEEEDAK